MPTLPCSLLALPCSSLALLAIPSCPFLRTALSHALWNHEPALPHTALCVSEGGEEEDDEEEDDEEEEELGYAEAEAEAVDDDAEEEDDDDEEEEDAGRGRGGRIGSMFAALSVDEGE